jgi:hypothetical protein
MPLDGDVVELWAMGMVLKEVTVQRARGNGLPAKGFIITHSDIGVFLNSSAYDARKYDAWTVDMQAGVMDTIKWEVLYEPPSEKGKPKRTKTGPWAGRVLPAYYWVNSRMAYSIAMRAVERSRQGTRLSDIKLDSWLTNASFFDLVE